MSTPKPRTAAHPAKVDSDKFGDEAARPSLKSPALPGYGTDGTYLVGPGIVVNVMDHLFLRSFPEIEFSVYDRDASVQKTGVCVRGHH